MSKHENYEDALFTLLMDEICSDEGSELLEECCLLNELEEFENESERLKLGKETISRELSRIHRQKSAAAALKSLRLLSVAAMITLVLGMGAYFAVPQFHDYVRDFFIDESVTKVEQSPGDYASGSNVDITAPEDYKEVSRSYEYADGGIVEIITYEDPETGKTFTVKVFSSLPASEPVHEDNSEEAGSTERVRITPPVEPTPFTDLETYTGPAHYPDVNVYGNLPESLYKGPTPLVPGANSSGQVGPSGSAPGVYVNPGGSVSIRWAP